MERNSDLMVYQVELSVALLKANDVFGYINISEIPYSKLAEIFIDQINNERFLFDDSVSYFIDKELYEKHQDYLENMIPFKFDFSLFEYSVGLSSIMATEYVKNYQDTLPPLLK